MKHKRYEGREDDLQQACADYLRLQYPNLLWQHPPNGMRTTIGVAAKFKRMGLTRGFPDVMIYASKQDPQGLEAGYWVDTHYGLAIELKVRGGSVSKDQKAIHEKLREAGWQVNVCWSFDEFKEVVDNYLK